MTALRRVLDVRAASRSTVLLGLAAAIAVAAAVIVTVTNHHSTAKHDAVVAYIGDVNAIQKGMKKPLSRAVAAYAAFATKGTLTPALSRRLGGAEATLRTLRARLRALPAPAPAVPLRRLLLRLADAQVGLAAEVEQLAVFNPRFAVLIAQAQKDATRLAAALKAVHPPASHRIRGTKAQVAKAQAAFAAASTVAAGQQADAVEAYDTAVAGVVARLRRLDPPPAMAPLYRSQLNALAASSSAGATLVAELRKPTRTNVAELARRFTLAARSSGSVTAQRRQVAAVKAYNARVHAVDALQQRIRTELGSLQQLDG